MARSMQKDPLAFRELMRQKLVATARAKGSACAGAQMAAQPGAFRAAVHKAHSSDVAE